MKHSQTTHYPFRFSRTISVILLISTAIFSFAPLAQNRALASSSVSHLGQNPTPTPDVVRASRVFAQAEVLYREGEYAEALPLYQEAVTLNPNDHVTWEHLAQTLAYLNRPDDAINAIDRSLAINSQNAEAWFIRGAIHLLMNNCTNALEDDQQALALSPTLDEAWGNMGTCYLRLRQYNDALNAFNRAIELSEGDASYYFNRGNVYRAMNDCPTALVDYQTAVDLNPAHADAYNNMANCYQTLGDLENAVHNIEIAIQLSSSAKFYSNLSEYLRGLEQYNEALAAADTAIELDSDYALAYRAKGNVYFDRGEYERAIESYQLGISKDHTEMSLWRNLGMSYYVLQQPEDAVESWEVIIEEGLDSPEYRLVLNDLAYLYIDVLERDYEHAIELAEQALELATTDGERANILDTIAWGHFKLGDCEKARQEIRQALELNPAHEDILRHEEIIDQECSG